MIQGGQEGNLITEATGFAELAATGGGRVPRTSCVTEKETQAKACDNGTINGKVMALLMYAFAYQDM